MKKDEVYRKDEIATKGKAEGKLISVMKETHTF